MNYPLNLSFKILALAPQIYVRDSGGSIVCYVKQKLFKLKEAVSVFADEGQTQLLCQIKADRVIDFNAKYQISDPSGVPLGSVSRKGMRSIFKAHYQIFDESGNQVKDIHEENAMIKVLDGLVSGIPIVGAFAGYFLNPSYLVTKTDGTPVARLKKQPAFLEGKFTLEKLGDLSPQEEIRVLMAVMMMTLLERSRG